MPEDMNNDRDAVLSFAQERDERVRVWFLSKTSEEYLCEEENREIEAAESFFALSMEEKMKMDREVAAVSRVRLARLGKSKENYTREQVEFGVNSAPKRSEDMTHFTSA